MSKRILFTVIVLLMDTAIVSAQQVADPKDLVKNYFPFWAALGFLKSGNRGRKVLDQAFRSRV